MNELKVTFYLKKNEERADGTMPILGRIRIGKSMVQFSTKVYAIPTLWDVKSGRAVGKSKPAATVNRELDRISLDIHSACKDLLAKKENVSALEVKNAFQGISSEQETLISLYEKCNDNFYKKVGISRKLATYKQYCVALNHLKDFLRQKYNVRDLPFQSLNPAFVSAYDLYLRSDLKIGRASVTRMMGYLHRVLKSAINNGHLKQDPFTGYTFDYVPIVPKFLSEKELKRMITTPLPKSNLNLVRDVFLFSAFTGLSFSDMRNLREENIRTYFDNHEWININRQKTGVESNIRLLDLPRRIIEKNRGLCEDGRIFPVPHYMTCLYGIRAVAKRCGITKHLTWYQSCHTAATTLFLSSGVPIETVSSMLGHKSIKTTQIYAKITKEKLNQDMENLVARLGSIEEFKRCNI